MKIMILASVAFFSLVSLTAANNAPTPLSDTPWSRNTAGMTESQKQEYLQKRAEAKRKRTGGVIINYATQKGEVLFLNAQKRVEAEPLTKRIGTMSEYFGSKFSLKTWGKPITLANAEATLKECGANAAVFIVDDPSIPVTLLNAPETKWSFINVAALAADKPTDKTLMERTRRELWRALGFMLGNDSVADVCVMKAVNSLKELDELGAEAPSSGPLILVGRRLRAIGVTPLTRATYSRALREGWAPMPTNELQRAVFERYQEMKKKEAEAK